MKNYSFSPSATVKPLKAGITALLVSLLATCTSPSYAEVDFKSLTSEVITSQNGNKSDVKSRSFINFTSTTVARSTDWRSAGEEFKTLQQEWKSVNPLPKEDSDKLWEQFNSACQSFFTARE